MQLIVHELSEFIDQELTPLKTTNVITIRPHIYKHGNPSGSLKVQVVKNEGVISESALIPISSISSFDYYHGYIRFELNVHLQQAQTYKIRLTHSGYSFSEGAWIGWCNGFDLGKYEENYTPNSGYNSGLDLEVWSKN